MPWSTTADDSGCWPRFRCLTWTPAIAEIAHCCDHLDVDGFVLLTNVGGVYVSDQSFEPVFRELDRRRARVLLHPTSPACWEHTSFGRPRPMLEFFFDTTRAVVDLVLNGIIAAYPDVRLIIPHAGATLPLVADRVSAFAHILAPDVDVLGDLGRLHFDLAGFAVPRQLDALLTMTTLDHLHYGSDFPFTPEAVVAAAAERLDGVDSLADALRSNTARLFAAHAVTHERTNQMEHQIELGYIVLEVPDPGTLAPVFADVVGLVPGEPTASGTATWRNDDRANRLFVQSGPANDAIAIGVEAVDAAAFDTVVSRLQGIGADVATR